MVTRFDGSFTNFEILKNVFSKIAKFGLRILIILVIVMLVLSALITVPVVQSAVVNEISFSVSKSLETDVSIQSVNLGWSGKMTFNEVLVRDKENDSMFYIEQVQFKLLEFSQSNKKFVFGNVFLKKPEVHFIQRLGATEMNYQFIIDLANNQPVTGHVSNILFKSLEIENGRFTHEIEGLKPTESRSFDENDFAFNHINGKFKDFYLVGDSLDFKIKALSTVEKNGFEIKRMVCKAKIHQKGMEYNDLQLKTAHSTIQDYLSFSYNSFKDFKQFVDVVRIETQLDNAIIDTKDLVYFSYNLKPYIHNVTTISGVGDGVVSDFEVKDFDIKLGNKTSLAGELDLKGLPDWKTSFIKLKLNKLTSTTNDVEAIMNLQLQEKVKRFQGFSFAGHLTGFYTDFAADGALSSNLGALESRINFKLLQDDAATYTGSLKATRFDIGTFLGNADFGTTSFNFDLEEGYGLTFANLRTRFQSQVEYLEYNGKRIKAITAKGLYTNQKFEGDALLNDEKLDFTFNGKIDFSKNLPKFDFTADIRTIDLKQLGLDSIDTKIAAKMDIQMSGNHADNLSGYANLSNIDITRSQRDLKLENLEIQSQFSDSSRSFKVVSDYVNGEINGAFSLRNLNDVYSDFLNTLFPEYYEPVVLNEEIKAKAVFNVKANDLIAYWTQYPLVLGNGKLTVAYDTKEESLESRALFDEVQYGNYKLYEHDLVVRKRPHQLLNLSTEVLTLVQKDNDTITDDIVLNMTILPNYVEFLLDFADTTEILALRSFGSLAFENDSIRIQMEESKFYLDQKPWRFNNDNWAMYTNSALYISNLELASEGQVLAVNGYIDKEANHHVVIDTKELDLNNLNPLLSQFDFEMGGVSNGSISIYQALSRPVIQGNLKIDELAVNGDTLGNFIITTKTHDNPLKMRVEATVKEGLLKDVSAVGTLDLSVKDGRLNMIVEATNAEIKPIESVFKGIASDFHGVVSGQIRVNGTFDKPKFKGVVETKDVNFVVDYLNTRYFVDDKIGLSNASIDFKSLVVRDKFKHTAKVRGQIKHDFFEDMVMDVSVTEANNIMVLNTTKTQNEIFYGTGFATGEAHFNGPVEDLYIDIKAKTNKGSRLTIPIYDDSDNAYEDYISFKKIVTDTVSKEQEQTAETDQKIHMNLEFDLTQDAEFVLLFDEVLDDKISGRGFGNVKIEYATGEDLFMYGIFEIATGIYPFSSPTLVSEKFDILPGGQVVWNGDPYNAIIDLKASVARNRANPWDLMKGMVDASNEAAYNTQLKMNVILSLKGELFNPEIGFGWDFPDLASNTFSEFNSFIKKIEADPDEMNRQVFSLITFGSFTPTADFGTGLGTTNGYIDIVSSSVGTFLSNQVNNWISEYDKDLELGVDYKTRTGITDQEKAELILSARRKIMNDRMELALVYNANSSAAKDPYNVDLVYKLKKDGSLKLKAYHKRASDPTLGDVTNVTTTGVGFYFRKQFDRIRFRKN
ncbi:MAG: hypothetical protein ACI9JN_001750 [Bacteroidia bacterium]|jgi:hypothetical protein